MKNHVRILGWIYILTCGPALILGLTICALLSLHPDESNRKALQFLGPPILMAACFGLIPGLVGGIGLLRSRPWARLLILVLSAFLLPLLPLGSALGLYGFWTLLTPETRAAFAASETAAVRSRAHAPSPLLNLLGVLAVVAAGFFLVIKIGFLVHHDPQPAPIANNALTATAVLILCAGAVAATRLAFQSSGKVATRARLRADAKRAMEAHAKARQRRAAELAADPARAKYAPLVERGEDWSDEKIAYNENPDRTATCAHLQPVERAMRAAGIEARLHTTGTVIAKCRIDYPAFQRAFPLAPPVRYAEFFESDRGSDDFPTAFLICDEHRSLVRTLHPAEAAARVAPVFPT